MEKTTNYQLNKPEAADPMRVSDFNENADIIDGLLGAFSKDLAELAGAVPKIAVGTYSGSGASTKAIVLGFRPKAVFAMAVRSETARTLTTTYTALAVEGTNYTNALTITDTGFTAICYGGSSDIHYPNLNNSGFTYVYFAIG